jgi:hypothetical protein
MCNLNRRFGHFGTAESLALVLLLTGWLGIRMQPCAGQAAPQKYKELPVDEAQGQSTIRTAMGRIRTNPSPSANDLATLERYYQTYALARWTLAANRNDISAYRRELRNDFRRIRSPQAYDQMNALVLSFMTNVAKGNFHPAARYNAMLTIGDLNVREPAKTTDLPVGPTAALQVLLEALGDAGQIDAVRAAALLGIARHAALKIADAQIRDGQVSPAMIALAKAADPPPGRTPEGHAWFRTLAIDTLALLARSGPQGQIANALADIAADGKTSMIVRCAAARALGKLDYQDPAGMDATGMTLKLARLASAVCDEEAAILEKQKLEAENASSQGSRVNYGGGSGGDMMESGYEEMMESMQEDMEGRAEMQDMYGYGRGSGGAPAVAKKKEEDTPETRRIKSSCRRLKSRMGCIMSGLQGEPDPRRAENQRAGVVAVAATQEQSVLNQKLYDGIEALIEELDKRKDQELDSDALDAAIETAAELCQQVLAGAATTAVETPPTTGAAADATAAAAP